MLDTLFQHSDRLDLRVLMDLFNGLLGYPGHLLNAHFLGQKLVGYCGLPHSRFVVLSLASYSSGLVNRPFLAETPLP